MSHGGPLGLPKTGATNIKERTTINEKLRKLRRIDSPDFFHPSPLFQCCFTLRSKRRVQTSLMALLRPVIMAFPSPKSIMVLSM